MNSSLKTLRIVMIGPIGSGKGTISDFMMKEYPNFVHISPGDIMRREIKNNTPLGQKAKYFVANGLLIPDKLIVANILHVLENSLTKNWILDGFPRSIKQAKMLHGISISKRKKKKKRTSRRCIYGSKGLVKNSITGVLNFIVPDEVIIERTSNRWTHIPSGRTYSAGFREPRVKWKDDETGEDLVQRDDDNPEIVRARLKLFRRKTEPVISFYRQHQVQVLDLHNYKMNIWPIVKKFLDENYEKCAHTY